MKNFLLLVSLLSVASTFAAQQMIFPIGIHPGQLVREVELDGKIYGFISRNNMNTYLPEVPNDFKMTFSGILLKEAHRWIPFLRIDESPTWFPIFELTGSHAKNNPLQFWQEGNDWYLSVVDAGGAGSGEGYAKLFSSTDWGESWQQINCWYHISEHAPVIQLTEAQDRQKNSDIHLLSDGRYIIETITDKESGRKIFVPLDSCSSAEVRRIK